MLFKLQMGTSVERLYVTVRDGVKAELAAWMASGGGKGAESSVPTPRRLQQFTSSLRTQVSDNWGGVLLTLQEVLDDLRRSYVPALVVYYLLKQLLAFLDVKVFNSLMIRSPLCPCTYSNGVTMGEGLARLIHWLAEVDAWVAEWLGPDVRPLFRELCHVQQAVFFLLLDDKDRRSMEDLRQMCPDLSMNQLVHVCIWYEDDKAGQPPVAPAVVELMWALMEEGSPMMLRDDESIPFTIDDVIALLDERPFELESVEAPFELLEKGLHFLAHKPKPPQMLPSAPRTPSFAMGHTPIWSTAKSFSIQ